MTSRIVLPQEVIDRGGREFPEIGAFNAIAWEYLLDASDTTVRELIERNNIPFKRFAKVRYIRAVDFWNCVPSSEPPA